MKPYYEENGITIYHGDCREVLPRLDPVDLVVTDPPYGETSLEWDSRIQGWADLLPARSLWCFGSMRFFLSAGEFFNNWTYAQDLVWEKHNGSNTFVDRFRRVHEHAIHFYKGAWKDLYKKPLTTPDASPRKVHRSQGPSHSRHYHQSDYVSHLGGPKLQRSVIAVRSCHGYAEHPTQKPLGILQPILEYSCPLGGIVLDPFMGSGSTLVCAKRAFARAIGIEIEEKYCEIAAKRLAQGVFAFG